MCDCCINRSRLREVCVIVVNVTTFENFEMFALCSGGSMISCRMSVLRKYVSK